MKKKQVGKKGTLLAAVAIAMLVGATGATVLKTTPANAATTTTTTTPAVTKQSQGSTGSSSTDGSTNSVKSNEDPTHEAQESAQWEAAENAGKQPWTNPSAYGGNPHTQSSGSTSH